MSLVEDYKWRVGYKRWQVDDPRPNHLDRRVLEVESTDGRSVIGGDIALVTSRTSDFGDQTRLWITLSIEQARELAQHLAGLIERVDDGSSIGGAA